MSNLGGQQLLDKELKLTSHKLIVKSKYSSPVHLKGFFSAL